MNGKSYRGRIEVAKKKNGLLLVVNELDIEDYLRGVVAAEIPPDWEPEALRAQAVASRTYALYQKRTSGARPYHILATVDSQVYNGRSAEHRAAAAAVADTEGIVITYQGEIIPAFYHASCGGTPRTPSISGASTNPISRALIAIARRFPATEYGKDGSAPAW